MHYSLKSIPENRCVCIYPAESKVSPSHWGLGESSKHNWGALKHLDLFGRNAALNPLMVKDRWGWTLKNCNGKIAFPHTSKYCEVLTKLSSIPNAKLSRKISNKGPTFNDNDRVLLYFSYVSQQHNLATCVVCISTKGVLLPRTNWSIFLSVP